MWPSPEIKLRNSSECSSFNLIGQHSASMKGSPESTDTCTTYWSIHYILEQTILWGLVKFVSVAVEYFKPGKLPLMLHGLVSTAATDHFRVYVIESIPCHTKRLIHEPQHWPQQYHSDHQEFERKLFAVLWMCRNYGENHHQDTNESELYTKALL